MGRILSGLLCAGLVVVAWPAQAQSSWGGLYPSLFITSDYRYDGVSSTGHEPTVQASLYWWRPDNFYAGVWVSGVDYSDLGDEETSIETDIYGGRNFDFGATRLTLEAMYSIFPDQEVPGPTYDFFTAKARVQHKIDALTMRGAISWIPEASYGAGPAWRLAAEASYKWTDWLTTSANLGRRWSDERVDRTFWDIGVILKWRMLSLDVRYADTDLSFSECGFVDWCESGVNATLQIDFWE
jgi:uncharacterized protein (TIGR02001 family)